MNPFRIHPGPLYSGSTPARDREYLRYIKSCPCVACGQSWWVDPAHTGPHALGQKASDYDTIPLCRECHRDFDTNPVKFAEAHKLDLPALIQMFRSLYLTRKGRAA